MIDLIIDTDPGIDDALAIALMAVSPEIRLKAVVATYGNSPASNTARNARYVLDTFGATKVPVYVGAQRPLVKPLAPAFETHGQYGLGYVAVPQVDRFAPGFGPSAILDILRQSTSPVTLLTIGPLTDAALALAQDADIMKERVARIVMMGGSAGAPGNTTPVTEYNFWCDPEAAAAVFQSGIPITMVGLDVTREIIVHGSLVAKLADLDDPKARFLGDAMRFYVDFHREREGLDGCIINDPLAAALLIDESLCTYKSMRVDICTEEGLTRGLSVCDRFGFLGKEPNAKVALRVNALAALEFIFDRLLPGVLTREELGLGLEDARSQVARKEVS